MPWLSDRTIGGIVRLGLFTLFVMLVCGATPCVSVGASDLASHSGYNFAFDRGGEGRSNVTARAVARDTGSPGVMDWYSHDGAFLDNKRDAGWDNPPFLVLGKGSGAYQRHEEPILAGRTYILTFEARTDVRGEAVRAAFLWSEHPGEIPTNICAEIVRELDDEVSSCKLRFKPRRGDPSVGKFAGVRIENGGDGWICVNNVRVTGIERVHAYSPTPSDGGSGTDPRPVLAWHGTAAAASYDLYLGTNAATVREADGRAGKLYIGSTVAPGWAVEAELQWGVDHHWRVDQVDANGVITKGFVWHFASENRGAASEPYPSHGNGGVVQDVTLSWRPGQGVESQKLTFGTNLGSLVTQSVGTNSAFTPAALAADKSYYWRVDSIIGGTVYTGRTWQFAVACSEVVVRMNGGAPVLHCDTHPGIGSGVSGPSLIRVPDWVPIEKRVDPSARYYLYYACGTGTNIGMAWAANVSGPYVVHKPDRGVLSIASCNGLRLKTRGRLGSPDVHVDSENKRIVMYAHCSAQWAGLEGWPESTLVAMSSDGSDFNKGVADAILGPFYYRAFTHGGELYAISNLGVVNHSSRPGAPFSQPDPISTGSGAEQYTWDAYLWERFMRAHEDPEAGTKGYRVHRLEPLCEIDNIAAAPRHSAVWVQGDKLHWFFSRISDQPERIQCATVDLSQPWIDWQAGFLQEILAPEARWERAITVQGSMVGGEMLQTCQLKDPCVFIDDDGAHYLLYVAGGDQGIGMAKFSEAWLEGRRATRSTSGVLLGNASKD